MAFTPGELLEIHPKSLLFQEYNSIQSIPARKLLDPMEKEGFGFPKKQTDMEGPRQIRAELLHPGTWEGSVGRDFQWNLQPGWSKAHQKSTAKGPKEQQDLRCQQREFWDPASLAPVPPCLRVPAGCCRSLPVLLEALPGSPRFNWEYLAVLMFPALPVVSRSSLRSPLAPH